MFCRSRAGTSTLVHSRLAAWRGAGAAALWSATLRLRYEGAIPNHVRHLPSSAEATALHSRAHHTSPSILDEYKAASATISIRDLSEDLVGQDVVLHGYLGSRSDISKKLSFAPLLDEQLERAVQIISVAPPSQAAANDDDSSGSNYHHLLKHLGENVPVIVTGRVQQKVKPKEASRSTENRRNEDVEIKLASITALNSVRHAVEIDAEQQHDIPVSNRHLHLRHNRHLRHALLFRSSLANACRDYLSRRHDFAEMETPLLFKSTPEGAREFLVPCRTPGLAYALPQSPQQYKQILMGSGFARYYQIAKCFRDEDLRADRQPEFTQLDLEMSFATGQDVMSCVEGLAKHLWKELLDDDLGSSPFCRLTYEEAMSRFGSDKPDMRLGSEIIRIEHMIPADLTSKIGPLTSPIVEAFSLRAFEDPSDARRFVSEFMDSPEARPFVQNPDGQPGIFIYDSRKPLGGLQSFGFEAAEVIEEQLQLEEGDIVVIQARKGAPFSGGSTSLGNMRLALHRFARLQGSTPPPEGWAFLWVHKFPLFSPSVDNEPGQGGRAGIASTHHPFTAPATREDIDLMENDPLQAKADHYDLVLNGVELGGGSRRIHLASVQEYVFRDVLKMPQERIKDFEHLLEVLGNGCPPHAGMALGFDRLCAVMLGKDSIRDVIAFPKTHSGTDPLVNSPTRMTPEQLKTYHLKLA